MGVRERGGREEREREREKEIGMEGRERESTVNREIFVLKIFSVVIFHVK